MKQLLFLYFSHDTKKQLIRLVVINSFVINSFATTPPYFIAKNPIHFEQIHQPVISQKGMVVTQNVIASKVGRDILKQGGNAVDAAVAVGFALAVTLPRAGNIGGGGFMLIYHQKTGKTYAINYYGKIPLSLKPNNPLPFQNSQKHTQAIAYQTVAMPGTVAGLWKAHRKFGKLPWHHLLKPAIQFANQGIRLGYDEAQALRIKQTILSQDPGARKIFLKPNGNLYQPNELLKQPDLAWSLAQIQSEGKHAFYKGKIAKRLLSSIKANQGLLNEQDFANYKAQVTTPIWSSYRGHPIACMPAPGTGSVLTIVMNLLEPFPLQKYGQNTTQSIHILAEALKHRGSSWWYQPNLSLMDKKKARQATKLISLDHTKPHHSQSFLANTYPEKNGETTHYSIVDTEGNVVSNTYTLSNAFGAGVVPPGTGILLNNSLKNLFWRPEKNTSQNANFLPHQLQSSISPVIVFKQGKPWIVTGTAGGSDIISIIVQLLVNVIDHQLNIAEATMRPRVNQLNSSGPLELENAITADLIPLLANKGHRIQRVSAMGSSHSIVIENGMLYGAADPRRPSAAAIGID